MREQPLCCRVLLRGARTTLLHAAHLATVRPPPPGQGSTPRGNALLPLPPRSAPASQARTGALAQAACSAPLLARSALPQPATSPLVRRAGPGSLSPRCPHPTLAPPKPPESIPPRTPIAS